MPERGRGFLLRLYPRAFRERYGEELSALLAVEKLSFSTTFDLLGGVLDAWLNPQKIVPLAHASSGAEKMNTRFLSVCASGAPRLTIRESLQGAGVILLGSLLLAVVQLLLTRTYGQVPAVEALRHVEFPAILLLATRAIYLQHRSWRTQVAFVGGLFTVIYLITLLSV